MKNVFYYVKTMLDEDKLNYGFFPKGLLPFHKYKDHISTAFEEHLFEAALYAHLQKVKLIYISLFQKNITIPLTKNLKRIEEIVEDKTKTVFQISFSYQKRVNRYYCCRLQRMNPLEMKTVIFCLDLQVMVHFLKI